MLLENPNLLWMVSSSMTTDGRTEPKLAFHPALGTSTHCAQPLMWLVLSSLHPLEAKATALTIRVALAALAQRYYDLP